MWFKLCLSVTFDDNVSMIFYISCLLLREIPSDLHRIWVIGFDRLWFTRRANSSWHITENENSDYWEKNYLSVIASLNFKIVLLEDNMSRIIDKVSYFFQDTYEKSVTIIFRNFKKSISILMNIINNRLHCIIQWLLSKYFYFICKRPNNNCRSHTDFQNDMCKSACFSWFFVHG